MNKSSMIAGLITLVISSLTAAGMDYGMESAKPTSKAPETTETTQASMTISSPDDGAVLPANKAIQLDYKAFPGQKGNHVHLYVDGKLVAILRQLSGDYELKALTPGKHKIDFEIVTSDHHPIGVGKEINVEAR